MAKHFMLLFLFLVIVNKFAFAKHQKLYFSQGLTIDDIIVFEKDSLERLGRKKKTYDDHKKNIGQTLLRDVSEIASLYCHKDDTNCISNTFKIIEMLFNKFQNVGKEKQIKMIQDDYLPKDLDIDLQHSLNELFDIIKELDYNDDQNVQNITKILSAIRHEIKIKPGGNVAHKMVAISGVTVAIEMIMLWSNIYKDRHHPLHKMLSSANFSMPSSPKELKFMPTSISTQNDDTSSIPVATFLVEKIICIIMYSVFGAILAPFFFLSEVLLGNFHFALVLLSLPLVFPLIIQFAIIGSIAGAGAGLFGPFLCEQLWIIF